MQIINKDILTVKSGIICSQVNCKGVMGKGIAKSIRDKWPIVYEDYMEFYNFFEKDNLLGRVRFSVVNKNDLIVASMFSQFDYGREKRLYTDYKAFDSSLKYIKNSRIFRNHDLQIYFPYGIGAGLGGGDWNIIEKMIDKYFPNANICKL